MNEIELATLSVPRLQQTNDERPSSGQVRPAQIIFIQQNDNAKRSIYGRIIYMLLAAILFCIFIRWLYSSMLSCDNHRMNAAHMFHLMDNRRYLIEQHASHPSKQTWPFGTGSLWTCNDDHPKNQLFAMPFQYVQQSDSVKNLTKKRIEDLFQSLVAPSLSKCHNDGQNNRIQRLRDVCERYGFQNRLLSPWHLNNKDKTCDSHRHCPLFIDEPNNLAGCFVAKVFEKSDLQNMFPDVHQNHRISPMDFVQIANSSLVNNERSYSTILFTRHPFVRLVQAFRQRFELPKWTDDGKPFKIDHETMHVWTFKEWCEELLLPTDPYQYDGQWAPIFTQCEPCYVPYDFIGHVETFQNDVKRFKNNQTETTNHPCHDDDDDQSFSITWQYLKLLSPETIIALYKKYYLDFELFGYSIEQLKSKTT